MYCTLLGSVSLANPLQPLNALSPKVVTPLGIVNCRNPVHPLNACSSIVVIPSDNVIDFSMKHPENAPYPNPFASVTTISVKEVGR